MAINTAQQLWQHELQDIYDAEHQFLMGQQEMLANASDPTLQGMLTEHIKQTEGHIANLEQVFRLAGLPVQREMCDAAKGLVSEAKKTLSECKGNPQVCDNAILGAASRVEHYEIAVYRGLITGAQIMGQADVVSLLKQNLEQEEQTAQKIEQTMPQMLQKAAQMAGSSTPAQPGTRA
jgi:ferritin-like metal-binding protein YciE